MFTGIIEEIGRVREMRTGVKAAEIIIGAEKVLKGTNIGDSIAVNGLCLTVTEQGKDFFAADIMPESLRRSNLGKLKKGDAVNLERAMAADGRFGGHIVSGHIDGTGVIYDMQREENAVWVRMNTDKSILKYIVEKGSAAIDGISLTVAEVYGEGFAVSVIPHTGEETTLLKRKKGYTVNIECDIVGKYIERFMTFEEDKKKIGITESFLKENGFI